MQIEARSGNESNPALETGELYLDLSSKTLTPLEGVLTNLSVPLVPTSVPRPLV